MHAASISLLAALWLFIVVPRQVERIRAEVRLQQWRIVLVASCLGLRIFLLLRDYQVDEASWVGPVYNMSLIFTVLAGIVLLGERDNTRPKVIGAGIALSGVLLLRLL